MLSQIVPIAFLLLSIALNFVSAAANAGSNHGNRMETRDNWQPNGTNLVCFFMTSEVNWQGEEQNLCQVGGQCAGLLPDGLSSNVSSAGGNPGQTCFLYTAENCTGNASAPINYPGFADLSAIGFAKKAVSWRCYKWCGYVDPASTDTTTTTMITTTSTMSANTANAVAMTNRDVFISTTLSGPQPTASTGTTVSISTTKSTSTSTSMSTSSVHTSVLPPLSSTPAPISESTSSSVVSVSTTKSSSSSTPSVSTTLTSGTSSTTSHTTALPLLPFSSFTPQFGTGTGNAAATDVSTSWILLTHTFGGRGGTSTTLLSVMLTGPAVPAATKTPASKI